MLCGRQQGSESESWRVAAIIRGESSFSACPRSPPATISSFSTTTRLCDSQLSLFIWDACFSSSNSFSSYSLYTLLSFPLTLYFRCRSCFLLFFFPSCLLSCYLLLELQISCIQGEKKPHKVPKAVACQAKWCLHKNILNKTASHEEVYMCECVMRALEELCLL